ncbi:hypothetical protein D9M72_549120 [compost metagenome]
MVVLEEEASNGNWDARCRDLRAHVTGNMIGLQLLQGAVWLANEWTFGPGRLLGCLPLFEDTLDDPAKPGGGRVGRHLPMQYE